MGAMSTVRALIQDRLQADSYFADIPVLLEEKGDISKEIARALGGVTNQGGKLGVYAIVLTARADIKDPVPGPYLDAIQVTVHVEESVLLNQSASGTQKACSDVAERVAGLLHRWTPDGWSRPVLLNGGSIQAVEPAFADRAYAVTFRVSGGITVALTTVATPTATPSSGAVPQTVTLACATGGAAIFYTLDGRFPSPTAGTLYTEPVVVASACTLKAAGWLAGKLTSAVVSATYT